MKNIIAEKLALMKIAKALDEVIKIRDAYGNVLTEFSVDEYTHIKFFDSAKECIIEYSGRNFVRYNYANAIKLIKTITKGLIFGLVKGPISIEKEARNQYYPEAFVAVADTTCDID